MAVPAIPSQFDVQAAVGGAPVNVAGQPLQGDAAVRGFKFNVAAHVGNMDTAVMRLRIYIGLTGHEHFVRYRPVAMPIHFRTFSLNLPGSRGNPNLRG